MSRDQSESEAFFRAESHIESVLEQYTEIEREADEIDAEVERVERSIAQGARRSGSRFRLCF
jgi:hypothetical protein